MREILFRGKRTDAGEFVYGNVAINRFLDEVCISEVDAPFHSFVYPVEPKTIGQFTGLTDKNGRRIFEGDICRNTKTGEIVSVKWHGTMAGFVWSKRKEKSHLYDFGELFRVHDKYEVIGNIHDNPELLEGNV